MGILLGELTYEMGGTSSAYNAVLELGFNHLKLILKGLIVFMMEENGPNSLKEKGNTRDVCWFLKPIVKDFDPSDEVLYGRGGDCVRGCVAK